MWSGIFWEGTLNQVALVVLLAWQPGPSGGVVYLPTETRSEVVRFRTTYYLTFQKSSTTTFRHVYLVAKCQILRSSSSFGQLVSAFMSQYEILALGP